MRTYGLIVLIICMGFFAYGCVGKPDLVVTTLQATGPAVRPAAGAGAEVPIRVIVKNQGKGAAGRFKVATKYTGSQGTYLVPFIVPGNVDPGFVPGSVFPRWYLYTSGLGAGESWEILNGKVTFHPSLASITVSLKAIADSCAADEFMPSHCRVNESDENNNESTSISVTLPPP